MQKFLKHFIRLGIVLAIALLALPVLAQATIVVDHNTANSGCTVSEAISAAENDAAANGCDAMTGTSFTSGGTDTIIFEDDYFGLPGTHADGGGNGIAVMSAEATITSNIIIDGIYQDSGNDGATFRAIGVEVRAASGNRHFTINSGTLTVQGVTIGRASLSDKGAIQLLGGNLVTARSTRKSTLTDNDQSERYARFVGNSATSNKGGALFVNNSSSTATLTRAYFEGNAADDAGGAIAIGVNGGTVNINRSVFAENESTASDAEGGGAIWMRAGTLTVDNSVFYDNVSSNSKGVVQVEGGTATLRHVLITTTDTANVYSDTGIDGAGGTTTLTNSIIAHMSNAADTATACEGNVTGNGNLLFGTNNCSSLTPFSTADPQVDYDGANDRFLPKNTSPIIDAVTCVGAGADFNFTPRPQDAKNDGGGNNDCDIGPLEVIAVPVDNSTIYVDTNSDTVAADGECSLREAIENINNTDRGNIDCEVGGTLTATIDLYVNLHIMLTASLPNITTGATGTLTRTVVNGNGAIIDGQNLHSLLRITSPNAEIRHVTMQNGKVSTRRGGALSSAGNNIMISNSAFLNNTAEDRGGGAVSVADGSTVTFDNVIFEGNKSTSSASPPVESSAGQGGAIFLATDPSALVTIKNSAFINNTSDRKGGAIYGSNFSLNITNTTFSGNVSNSDQTKVGVAVYLSGSNGVVKNYTFTHVTFANNSAPNAAAGSAALAVLGDGSLTVRNSLFSGNSVGSCFNESSGTAGGSGNLYSGSSTGCPGGDVSGDPQLQPLSGVGYARAHDPGPLGAAVNAVACIGGVEDDQRNSKRPFPADGQCDVGAVEYGSPIPTPEPTEDPSLVDPGDPTPFISPTPSDDGGAVTTRRRRGTPAPTRTPVPTKPLGQVLNELGYFITATNGLHSGVQFKMVDGGGVGNDEVLALGFIDAIDIFGWVEQGVTVCFKQLGRVVFLDAKNSPRTYEDIASYGTVDGKTCVDLNRAGTLVLVYGSPTVSAGAAGTKDLSGCMVTLTEILNFRDGPGGGIMGILPSGVTLTALERTSEWFHVDYHGTQGWISANYVIENGTCS